MFIERSPHRLPRIGVSDLFDWLGRPDQAGGHKVPVPSNMLLVRPRWLPPIGACGLLNWILVRRDARRVARFMGGRPCVAVCIAATPNAVALLSSLPCRSISYLNVFDYDALAVLPSVRVAERRLVALSDGVFAHSASGVERLRALAPGRGVRLCEPGVDFEAFASVCRPSGAGGTRA